jgi:hypothetical protein
MFHIHDVMLLPVFLRMTIRTDILTTGFIVGWTESADRMSDGIA